MSEFQNPPQEPPPNGPEPPSNGGEAITLETLRDHALWVGWKNELRDGELTKVPYDPRYKDAKALANNPRTWRQRHLAEGWVTKYGGDGIGIEFAPIGNGLHLGGIDLDTCLDPENKIIEPWAAAVIERFASYCEISPSGTGVKFFFTYRITDKAALFAGPFAGTKGGRQFKQSGNGGSHPPGIEVYCAGRFFAVTDRQYGERDDLRTVSVADLEWLVNDKGPAFAGNGSHGADVPEGKSKSTDNTRSGKAFRRARELLAKGFGYPTMRDTMLDDPDPEIAAWAREKGMANNQREMKRLFSRAGFKGGANFKVIQKTISAAPESEANKIFWQKAAGAKLTKAEINALVELVADRCGARVVDVRADFKDARSEHQKEANKQKAEKRRQSSKRRIEPWPMPDGERLPVMRLLDGVLTSNELEPPMRNMDGWPIYVRVRVPINMHELTSDTANADEAGMLTPLPAPPLPSLPCHDQFSLAHLIKKRVEFVFIDPVTGDETTKALSDTFVQLHTL